MLAATRSALTNIAANMVETVRNLSAVIEITPCCGALIGAAEQAGTGSVQKAQPQCDDEALQFDKRALPSTNATREATNGPELEEHRPTGPVHQSLQRRRAGRARAGFVERRGPDGDGAVAGGDGEDAAADAALARQADAEGELA